MKSKCKASMKKEYHSQNVTLQHETGNIISAYCTCKAGKSSYCNHIMALLLELAEYSLYELTEVPSEVACTSKARKWGIPGEKDFPKEPILSTTIQRNLASRGIKSTLYNPCLSSSHCVDMNKLEALQNTLRLSNKHIGFAHIIPPPDKCSAMKTKFGMQALGSPLSYQLAPVEFNFEVHICWMKICHPRVTTLLLNILQICQLNVYLHHQKKVITVLMKNAKVFLTL